jgi:hypothetical protein
MVINFLWRDSPLTWRWDELIPVHDQNQLVSGWTGTSHAGQATWTYSLALDSADHMDSLPHQVFTQDSSVYCFQGSTLLDTQECSEVISSILAKYDQLVAQDKTSAHQILQTIDYMWVQEIMLQTSGEFANVVLEAALAVEHGSTPIEAISLGSQRFEEVELLALESFQVRANAREGSAAKGGLEELRNILCQGCHAAQNRFQPLMSDLVDKSSAAQIKVSIENMLENLSTEFGFISELKDANAELFVELREGLDRVQQAESIFSKSVLQVAASNPQNLALQRISLNLGVLA